MKKPKKNKSHSATRKVPWLRPSQVIGKISWVPMTHVKRGETIQTPHGYSITKL